MSKFDFMKYKSLCDQVDDLGIEANKAIEKAAQDYIIAAVDEIESLLGGEIREHRSYHPFNEIGFARHCDIEVDGTTARFEDSDREVRWTVYFDDQSFRDPVVAGKAAGKEMYDTYKAKCAEKKANKISEIEELRARADRLERELNK